jgi:DNA-binding Lrp family transcriptional regulator
MTKKTLVQIILFITLLSITVSFGAVFDVALLRSGLSPLTVLLVANALTGAVVAFAHLQREEHEAQRLLAVDENLKILREMNHEVRSVLGVVAFYGKQTRNDYVLKVFDNGFKRMDSIMREVLGRGQTLDQSQDLPPEVPARSGLHVVGGAGRRPPQSLNTVRTVVPSD